MDFSSFLSKMLTLSDDLKLTLQNLYITRNKIPITASWNKSSNVFPLDSIIQNSSKFDCDPQSTNKIMVSLW